LPARQGPDADPPDSGALVLRGAGVGGGGGVGVATATTTGAAAGLSASIRSGAGSAAAGSTSLSPVSSAPRERCAGSSVGAATVLPSTGNASSTG
jgi:hypothetical protein